MRHVIIGTAGHIDHGKSALVRALTGTDPDRLKEEKERGLTIDLGFAFLGDNAAFIDVPGHERFIKNMVAGVSTVDMVMFVIAADDGIMPQTREHLDILQLLQLKRGLIAVTKIDLVEQEWLDLVIADIQELVKNTFLEEAPILPVSSTTSAGIEALRQELEKQISKVEARKDQGIFWLPIDRAFTIKGFGTVVTGSVLSGSAKIGDELELLPQGKNLRIRGLQTHGQDTQLVQIGDRAAINISNIHKDEIQRGDILATQHYFTASKLFDARLTMLPSNPRPLVNRARIRIHIGTRELLSRVTLLDKKEILPGDWGYVQFRLEETAVGRRKDPFVIRQYSPVVTIGGGVILDTHPRGHKRFDQNVLSQLKSLEKESPREVVEAIFTANNLSPLTVKTLAKETGILTETVEEVLQNLKEEDKIISFGSKQQPLFFWSAHIPVLWESFLSALRTFHKENPLKAGIARQELRALIHAKLDAILFAAILDRLLDEKQVIESGKLIALPTFRISLAPEDEALRNKIADLLLRAKFSTPSVDELASQINESKSNIIKVLTAMLGMGDVVKLEGDLYFHKSSINEAQKLLQKAFTADDEISVSAFRELLGTTRRYAMALLVYFDTQGITERVGETRMLRVENT